MITVIVPYKNASKWIERCINSLKAQTGNAEFLIVSDYDKKIKLPRDKRFKWLENEHAPGVSGARNTGLDHAKGEWITFLDADDELMPGAIQVYEAIASESKSQIYQTNHKRYYAEKDKLVLKYWNNDNVYGLYDLPACWCMVWNKLYSCELVKDVRFREGMQYGEDELFNIECLAKQKWIRHGRKNEITVIRNFDNKQSLSRSKQMDALLLQAYALMEFIAESKDAEMRQFVCGVLSEHWGSPTYKTVAGRTGAEK